MDIKESYIGDNAMGVTSATRQPVIPSSGALITTSKYSGRSQAVAASDPVRVRTIRCTLDAVHTVEPLVNSRPEWGPLKADLVDCAAVLSNPEQLLPLYKLEIFGDAICPYLSSIKGRMSVSKDRIPQLRRTLEILDMPGAERLHVSRHPASVLVDIEMIIQAIDAEPSWFRSDLSTKFKYVIDKQWAPILGPLRSDLKSLAMKLIFLSFVEIARPLVLAWPLMSVMREAMLLVQAIDERKANSRRPADIAMSVIHICKALLLLIIVYQATSLLSLLAGSGYMFGVIGVAIMILQSSDALLKPNAAVIAEHLAPVMGIIDQVHKMETKFVGQFSNTEVSSAPPVVAAVPLTQRQLLEQRGVAAVGAHRSDKNNTAHSPIVSELHASVNAPEQKSAADEVQETTEALAQGYWPLYKFVTSKIAVAAESALAAPAIRGSGVQSRSVHPESKEPSEGVRRMEIVDQDNRANNDPMLGGESSDAYGLRRRKPQSS